MVPHINNKPKGMQKTKRSSIILLDYCLPLHYDRLTVLKMPGCVVATQSGPLRAPPFTQRFMALLLGCLWLGMGWGVKPATTEPHWIFVLSFFQCALMFGVPQRIVLRDWKVEYRANFGEEIVEVVRSICEKTKQVSKNCTAVDYAAFFNAPAVCSKIDC
jgi:hypothetical protein